MGVIDANMLFTYGFLFTDSTPLLETPYHEICCLNTFHTTEVNIYNGT